MNRYVFTTYPQYPFKMHYPSPLRDPPKTVSLAAMRAYNESYPLQVSASLEQSHVWF